MGKPVKLAAVLEASDARRICTELREQRGQALEIAGDEVMRVSTLVIQVLLAAATSWRADAIPFRLGSLSPELDETLRTLGLGVEAFQSEGVAS